MKTWFAVLVAVIVAGLLPNPASAQKFCDPWGNQGCVTVPPRGGSDSDTDRPRYRRPSRKEQEREAAREAAVELNNKGAAASRKQDWDEAMVLFARAAKLDPDNKVIRANLMSPAKYGEEWFAKGDWYRAGYFLQIALKYFPKSKKLKRMLAIAESKYSDENARSFRARELADQAGAAKKEGDFALAERLYLEAATIYPEGGYRNSAAHLNAMQGMDLYNGAFGTGLQTAQSIDVVTRALAFLRHSLEIDSTELVAHWTSEAERRLSDLRLRQREEEDKARQAALAQQDTTVVNVQNLPPDLPADQVRAITGAYENAPAGVIERVQKGFQAVNTHDWVLAKAWFGDALLRDPTNASLKNLMALLGHLERREQTTAEPPKVPVVPQSYPNKKEVDTFFANFRDGRAQTPGDAVRTYVASLTNEEFKHLLWDLQPTDDDMVMLFDLLGIAEPKSKQ